jgi:hypothetical protein
MTTKIEEEKILKLAQRLAQKLPLDSSLEREVIDIVDVLNEAFDLGYWSGYSEGENVGWLHGVDAGRGY